MTLRCILSAFIVAILYSGLHAAKDCQDENPNCGEMAVVCVAPFLDYASIYCRQSCGLCNTHNAPGQVEVDFNKTIDHGNRTCYDRDPSCRQLGNKICGSDYGKVNCGELCEFCGPAASSAPTTDAPTAPPTDTPTAPPTDAPTEPPTEATTTAVHLAVCNTTAEVIFVLDASSSVGSANFERMRIFTQNVTGRLETEYTSLNVTVITFSDNATLAFQLDQTVNISDVNTAIQNITYIHGGTNTHKALSLMSQSFHRDVYGPKIAIVITDGASFEPAQTVVEAANAKTLGTVIFVVGVGDDVNQQEAVKISSEPHERYYYRIDNFVALDSIVGEFHSQDCLLPTTPAPTTTTKEPTTTTAAPTTTTTPEPTTTTTLAPTTTTTLAPTTTTTPPAPTTTTTSPAPTTTTTTEAPTTTEPTTTTEEQTTTTTVPTTTLPPTTTTEEPTTSTLPPTTTTEEKTTTLASTTTTEEQIATTQAPTLAPTTTTEEPTTTEAMTTTTEEMTTTTVATTTTAVQTTVTESQTTTTEAQTTIAPTSTVPPTVSVPATVTGGTVTPMTPVTITGTGTPPTVNTPSPSPANTVTLSPPTEATTVTASPPTQSQSTEATTVTMSPPTQAQSTEATTVTMSPPTQAQSTEATTVTISPPTQAQSTEATTVTFSPPTLAQSTEATTVTISPPTMAQSTEATTVTISPPTLAQSTEATTVTISPPTLASSTPVIETTTTTAATTTTTPGSTTTASCIAKVADIVFVVDSSGSIGIDNFEKVKTFIKDVIQTLDANDPRYTRVGLIGFSTDAQIQFKLGEKTNLTEILAGVEALPYSGGGTSTSDALELMRLEGFDRERPGAPDIAIVITDGLSKFPALTTIQAEKAKASGITIMTLGIGSDTKFGELLAMASDKKFVFEVGDFEKLSAMDGLIAHRACGVNLPDVHHTRPTTTKAPVMTGCYDRDQNCGSYANDFCSDYEPYARENCAKTCKYCHDNETVVEPPCEDNPNEDCRGIGFDGCNNVVLYGWAETNCPKFCGFCTKKTDPLPTNEPVTEPPPPSTCKDTAENCHEYGGYSVCTAESFKGWAHTNCPKYCGFCYDYHNVTSQQVGGVDCPTWTLPSQCTLVYKEGQCCPYPECPDHFRYTVKRHM